MAAAALGLPTPIRLCCIALIVSVGMVRNRSAASFIRFAAVTPGSTSSSVGLAKPSPSSFSVSVAGRWSLMYCQGTCGILCHVEGIDHFLQVGDETLQHRNQCVAE